MTSSSQERFPFCKKPGGLRFACPKLKRRMPPVGVFLKQTILIRSWEESELMLSFMQHLLRRSQSKIREAMNWSLKQRFVDRELLTPELLGYERPKDVTGRYIKYAKLEINEEEAEIVRFIYDAFLTGRPIREIAVLLTDIGIPTKSGYTEWNDGSISYILKNERYCGNVLTWKTFHFGYVRT
ncbi:MAG: recombinase family protein [Eubacteriales bacterium]